MKRTDLPVIALATSKAWQAAIEREFSASMVVWALDETDLLTEAVAHPDSAMIVEFPVVSASGAGDWLALILEHRRRVWVVTGIEHAGRAQRLRAIGVTDVVVTTAEAPRLHKLIGRHNARVPQQVIPLEQQIESALPWRC